MKKKTEAKQYICKNYKKLPVKQRVSLIKVAQNLLKQQQENSALLTAAIIPESEKGMA